jgi:hypothetical protein
VVISQDPIPLRKGPHGFFSLSSLRVDEGEGTEGQGLMIVMVQF